MCLEELQLPGDVLASMWDPPLFSVHEKAWHFANRAPEPLASVLRKALICQGPQSFSTSKH